MSNIGQVQIGSVTYNVAKASAVKQKELLTLIGGRIALHSATSKTEIIDANLIMGSLVTSSEELFDRIAGIVLGQCVVSGGTDLVTIDDFQNNINSYFLLVANAVVENLGDFFTYLDDVNAATRRTSAQASQ